MRKSGTADGVTAQAVAGTYCVLLGFDATPGSPRAMERQYFAGTLK